MRRQLRMAERGKKEPAILFSQIAGSIGDDGVQALLCTRFVSYRHCNPGGAGNSLSRVSQPVLFINTERACVPLVLYFLSNAVAAIQYDGNHNHLL
jgi:hypothetical protein